MNENWLNNKFNVIYIGDTDGFDFGIWQLPTNAVLHSGKLDDIAFKIRQQELNNDEVFSGNLIINKPKKHIPFNEIFNLPLDDNSIYVKDFVNSSHAKECSVNQETMYCGSFVLWMISQYHRNDFSFYANLRRNRIVLKRYLGYINEKF